MRRRGHAATVVAGAFENDEPDSDVLVARRVRHLFGGLSFFDVGSLRFLGLLWSRVPSADVVHVSFAREIVPLWATLIARLTRTPAVLQPHGMLTSRSSFVHRVFDAFITRAVIPGRATVLALSERERAELERWNPRLRGRIATLGNPPPPGLQAITAERDGQPPVALFAARLHPRKRVLDFAGAAAIAHERKWTESYSVLGPDEGELERLLRVAGSVPRLKYLGATDSAGVIEQLKESGVFVLPAEKEPWGNVVVAAIKLGIPVVITRSSVLAQVIEESGAGRVVEDGSPEAIAEAVHAILDRENYRGFVRRARALADSTFDEEDHARELEALYLRTRGEVQ